MDKALRSTQEGATKRFLDRGDDLKEMSAYMLEVT